MDRVAIIQYLITKRKLVALVCRRVTVDCNESNELICHAVRCGHQLFQGCFELVVGGARDIRRDPMMSLDQINIMDTRARALIER